MPEITRFLGIVILMYFDEHNPPHFHVKYNEFRATIDIGTLNISTGSLPARVRGLVIEWAEPNQVELLRMWGKKEFHHLEPLV
jgi:hypothetical protein